MSALHAAKCAFFVREMQPGCRARSGRFVPPEPVGFSVPSSTPLLAAGAWLPRRKASAPHAPHRSWVFFAEESHLQSHGRGTECPPLPTRIRTSCALAVFRAGADGRVPSNMMLNMRPRRQGRDRGIEGAVASLSSMAGSFPLIPTSGFCRSRWIGRRAVRGGLLALVGFAEWLVSGFDGHSGMTRIWPPGRSPDRALAHCSSAQRGGGGPDHSSFRRPARFGLHTDAFLLFGMAYAAAARRRRHRRISPAYCGGWAAARRRVGFIGLSTAAGRRALRASAGPYARVVPSCRLRPHVALAVKLIHVQA